MEKTYSDSDVCSWEKTNESSKEEDVKWHIHNRRRQIDEKIGQGRCYPQKQHVVQQLFPTLCYL